MYTSRIIGGLFAGAVIPCAFAYASDSTDEENRNESNGTVRNVDWLRLFIFGPALGGVLSSFGLFVPFVISGILSLIMTAFSFFTLKESLRKESAAKVQTSRWHDFTSDFQGAMKYLYVLSFFSDFYARWFRSYFSIFSNSEKLMLLLRQSDGCLWRAV